MLGEHNIAYRPRTSVKGQILADFLIEMPGDVSQAVPVTVTQEEPWALFTDGSLCVDGSAEYETLVAGLRIATQMGVKNVQVNVDSKLVANQVLGTYVAKEDNMVKYLEIVKGLVLVEVLENKSIKEKEAAAVIEEDGPTWMTQLVDYLKEGVLPEDKKEARKLRLKARSSSMHAGPQSVVAKAIRLGYYWLKMHKDARDMIRKCSDCQIHHLVAKHPQQSLTPITAPWPFYKVRDIAFKPGDFVYRSNNASHAVAGGKLGPKWDGPYEVTEALGDGAYKLRSTDGTILPRTWNIANLKRCYL
nr:hypothetical protein [Tanacetum cinerariifolium]